MVSTVGLAQASGQTDEEKLAEYLSRVRQTLQLDYSMLDYTTSMIDTKVMGNRLAMIIEKTVDMCKSEANHGTLSIIQGRQIEGLNYCAK